MALANDRNGRRRAPEMGETTMGTTGTKEVRTTYVMCRTLGHAWEPFTPRGKRPAYFGYRLSLRCVRCGTERHDTIDMLGNVGSRSYEYEEDYKDAEKVAKEDYRLALLKTRKVKYVEEE